MKNPDLVETACLGFLLILFSFQSSKIRILSPLLLQHCFIKLVSIKTADLSPAPGLLLLSNSFFFPCFSPWPNQHKTVVW